MKIEILFKKIELRYNLISEDIFHKKFNDLSKKSKEKVIDSYSVYY